MVTTLKEITLKTKREERENIIFTKDVFYNLNLILDLLKFQKSNLQMALYMLANKKMDQDKGQEKPLMSMEVFMRANGKMIKNKEMVFFNTLMELNMMENGKLI